MSATTKDQKAVDAVREAFVSRVTNPFPTSDARHGEWENAVSNIAFQATDADKDVIYREFRSRGFDDNTAKELSVLALQIVPQILRAAMGKGDKMLGLFLSAYSPKERAGLTLGSIKLAGEFLNSVSDSAQRLAELKDEHRREQEAAAKTPESAAGPVN